MYISVSELAAPEDVLIRLTDDEGAGSVNAGRAEAAIAQAQAVIDGYLSLACDVPLPSPGDAVKKLASDIALHCLYQRAGVVPPDVQAAYEDAVAALEKAARGEFNIGLGAPQGGPAFSCRGRGFSRESMEGF